MAGYLRRMTFFVLDGKSTKEVMEERGWIPNQFENEAGWKEAVVRRIKCEDVTILTSDERKIQALWSSRHFNASGPTSLDSGERSAVILFHANAQIGLDLCEWARWYRNRSIDVLIVTMGGYGESEGSASEATACLDAQAALDWVLGTQNIPINKIIAHGLSIGGAVACSLGDANPGIHLVLDQTFTTAGATAHHIAQTKLPMGEMGLIPDWAVSGLVGSCLPSGQVIEAYPYGKPKETTTPIVYTTDGMNNIAKLKRMKRKAQLNDIRQSLKSRGVVLQEDSLSFQDASTSSSSSSSSSAAAHTIVEAPGSYRNCEVFFFCASQDEMMPQEFSRELLIARYGYGLDEEFDEESEDEESGEENGGNQSDSTVALSSGGGFFSWFRSRRSSRANLDSENDLNDGDVALGDTTETQLAEQIVREGEDNENNNASGTSVSNVLGIQPGISSDSTHDLVESVSIDAVLSTLSYMLLCGDDQRTRDQSDEAGDLRVSNARSSRRNSSVSRQERREARKLSREANALHLEAMRSERFAVLEGPHGTYFGGQRRPVAMYEAFLRNCKLLPYA